MHNLHMWQLNFKIIFFYWRFVSMENYFEKGHGDFDDDHLNPCEVCDYYLDCCGEYCFMEAEYDD